MININGVPLTTRTPGVYIEVDNSNALQGLLPWDQKILVLGQMIPADIVATADYDESGSATANELVFVASVAAAQGLFGLGSQLARMVEKIKAINPTMEVWAIPQGDGTTAAAGVISLTGTATAAGAIHLLVAGKPIRVAVSSGDTHLTVANNIALAINADPDLPVYTSSSAGAVVVVEAKCPGLDGNFIDMRLNYYEGEETPAGLTASITAMGTTPSTANPSIATAITAMGDEQFDYIACAYTDDANMTLLEAELLRRWGPMIQKEGSAFTAVKSAYSTLATWASGNSRNSHLVQTIGHYDTPESPSEWAAIHAALASYYLNIDPARPLQNLPLTGLMPPKETSAGRFTREERNVLLWNGISTWTVDAGGRVLMERSITNYRENAAGMPDPSYLDTCTIYTLMYIRYQFRARVMQKFNRHKLADDDTIVPPGAAVVRPRDIKAEIVSLFELLERQGIIENLDEFKNNLIVERSASDVNRVDVLLPADLVNQFRVMGVLLQYIL